MTSWTAGAAIAALCIIAGGCAGKSGTAEEPAPMPDNSMTSLDWTGTYSGVVPCADCEGIETSITLNQDRTYVMKTRYLGKDTKPFERQGTFAWNEEGNRIQLSGLADGPACYLVGENALIQLDKAGNQIAGDLAPKYVLAKGSGVVVPAASPAPAALFAPSWRLVELLGRPVPAPADGRPVPSLTFEKDGTTHGFAGCNSFGGAYEYKAGNHLSFSKIAATMMACLDMTVETEFLKVLGQVDSCSVEAQKLLLHKAGMAPLARFEAVRE